VRIKLVLCYIVRERKPKLSLLLLVFHKKAERSMPGLGTVGDEYAMCFECMNIVPSRLTKVGQNKPWITAQMKRLIRKKKTSV